MAPWKARATQPRTSPCDLGKVWEYFGGLSSLQSLLINDLRRFWENFGGLAVAPQMLAPATASQPGALVQTEKTRESGMGHEMRDVEQSLVAQLQGLCAERLHGAGLMAGCSRRAWPTLQIYHVVGTTQVRSRGCPRGPLAASRTTYAKICPPKTLQYPVPHPCHSCPPPSPSLHFNSSSRTNSAVSSTGWLVCCWCGSNLGFKCGAGQRGAMHGLLPGRPQRPPAPAIPRGRGNLDIGYSHAHRLAKGPVDWTLAQLTQLARLQAHHVPVKVPEVPASGVKIHGRFRQIAFCERATGRESAGVSHHQVDYALPSRTHTRRGPEMSTPSSRRAGACA
jgi:hypothetical protein